MSNKSIVYSKFCKINTTVRHKIELDTKYNFFLSKIFVNFKKC